MEKATEPWRGCDPALLKAIELFLQQWEPYSAQSRRYSIFRLFREVIDPAWFDFCSRHQVLNLSAMDAAWTRYQWDRFGSVESCGVSESGEASLDRVRDAFVSCGGKINGRYVLSELARYHGFGVLDDFLRLVARHIGVDLVPSIDSLRELALACRNKKAKRISGTDISVSRYATICRFCENQTEAAAYPDGNAPWQMDLKDSDDPSRRPRLSAVYCSEHRPKTRRRDSEVNKIYRAAIRKNNQAAFDKELERLDRQSWAGASSPKAKSGNRLVDEFMWRLWRLAAHENLMHEQQPAGKGVLVEALTKREARLLVKNKVSDRKKEIVVLLADGHNQAAVARTLGIKSRQAVSKALQSIPNKYRFDLLRGPSDSD